VLGHSHALVAERGGIAGGHFQFHRGLARDGRWASEPADEDHPYGHGKAEPIAAAIVSTMLLLAAVEHRGHVGAGDARRGTCRPARVHPAGAGGGVIVIKEGAVSLCKGGGAFGGKHGDSGRRMASPH